MVKNEITSMKLLESDNINNINKLKYKINTSKNIIEDCLEIIQYYKLELDKLNKNIKTENDILIIKSYKEQKILIEDELIQYKKKVLKYKSTFKRNNDKIIKIIGEKINLIDYNVLLILLDYINSGNTLYNLLFTNKLFYNLLQNEYKYYILLLKQINNNNKNIINAIKIPKYIFLNNNLTLDQILYIPLTLNNWTILHLCADNNYLLLFKYLYKIFPHLNINCITLINQYHPMHLVLLNNYIRLGQLLFKIGINNNYTCIMDSGNTYTICKLTKRYIRMINLDFQYELSTCINTYNNKIHTIYNFNILIENEYLMKQLYIIYNILKKHEYIINIIGL